MRECGKIHHVRDIRWMGLGAMCIYTLDFYCKKCDGKTAGLTELELPGADLLTWAKTVRNVATFHMLGY